MPRRVAAARAMRAPRVASLARVAGGAAGRTAACWACRARCKLAQLTPGAQADESILVCLRSAAASARSMHGTSGRLVCGSRTLVEG